MSTPEHTEKVHECISRIRAAIKKRDFTGIEKEIVIRQKNYIIKEQSNKFKIKQSIIKKIYYGRN